MAQITHEFRNTPLTEALRTIAKSQSEYTVAILSDDLAQFRTSAKVKSLSAPDAVKLVCKGLPVKVKVKGQKIYVQRKDVKAQKEDVKKTAEIRGYVHNRLTHEYLYDVKVSLMKNDSIVATCIIDKNITYLHPVWSFEVDIKEGSNYVLLFEKEGYNILSWPLREQVAKKPLKKGEMRVVADVPMDKTPKTHMLNGVTIKATKVKFYHKGDTLVYDADAFETAEGSMLDALIDQLPGVKLYDNGEIYVNGRKVESLMLNGEDFFKGNNNIMLENLPAYMVKNVKTYEKTGLLTQMMGRDMGDKEFVMDVILKKQYQIGWIGNVEVGKGNHDLYMARLFAVRFSPHSRITTFGKINNLSDERKPGENDFWSPEAMSSGSRRAKKAGADLLFNSKDKRVKYTGNIEFTHTDLENRSRTASETYLPDGNIFSRNVYAGRDRNLKLDVQNKFSLINKKFSKTMELQPNLSYKKYDSHSENISATFDKEPSIESVTEIIDSVYQSDNPALLSTIINRNLNRDKRDGYQLNMSLPYSFFSALNTSKNLSLTFGGNVNYSTQSNDNWRQTSVDYPSNTAKASDIRNRYSHSYPDHHFGANTSVSLGQQIMPGFSIDYRYSIGYNSSHNDNRTYLLERLAGWDDFNEHPIGLLPSEEEYLMCIDTHNSSYRRSSNVHQTPNVTLRYGYDYWTGQRKEKHNHYEMTLSMPLAFNHEKLDYARGTYDGITKRNTCFFNPSFTARLLANNFNDELSFNYRISHSAPPMMYSLDYCNDADPMNIFYYNADLKNMASHNASLNYTHKNTEKELNYSLNTSYNITTNSVAMSYIYDRATGIRSFRPSNVSGNYNFQLNFGYSRPLDKQKRLSLGNNLNWNMIHGVDLVGTDTGTAPERSSVMTNWINDHLHLNYRVNRFFRIGARGHIGYGRSTSRREDFNNVNLYNFDYGLNATLPLPWKMQLSTDLTMYSRRGDASSAANTNDLVWNARLSKTFLKAGLTFALDGFDILGQLSSLSQYLNSQGRTESYRNTLHSYVMAHVLYRLNKKPRRVREP